MSKELPDIPLSLNEFSRRMKMSSQRITRAVVRMEPPPEMEGKKIVPGEYGRIMDKVEELEANTGESVFAPGESFIIGEKLENREDGISK